MGGSGGLGAECRKPDYWHSLQLHSGARRRRELEQGGRREERRRRKLATLVAASQRLGLRLDAVAEAAAPDPGTGRAARRELRRGRLEATRSAGGLEGRRAAVCTRHGTVGGVGRSTAGACTGLVPRRSTRRGEERRSSGASGLLPRGRNDAKTDGASFIVCSCLSLGIPGTACRQRPVQVPPPRYSPLVRAGCDIEFGAPPRKPLPRPRCFNHVSAASAPQCTRGKRRRCRRTVLATFLTWPLSSAAYSSPL